MKGKKQALNSKPPDIDFNFTPKEDLNKSVYLTEGHDGNRQSLGGDVIQETSNEIKLSFSVTKSPKEIMNELEKSMQQANQFKAEGDLLTS